MSNTASAPASRDSHSWYSSRMNSFRRRGTVTAARTSTRSSRLPRKYFSSVSTDTAVAPERAYVRAWDTGSRSAFNTPCDGDALLTSAISETRRRARGRSAVSKSREWASPRHARSSSPRERSTRRRASSSRLCAMISSRTPIGFGGALGPFPGTSPRGDRSRLVVAAKAAFSVGLDLDLRHLLEHVLAQRAGRRQVADDAALDDERLQEPLGQLTVRAERGRFRR